MLLLGLTGLYHLLPSLLPSCRATPTDQIYLDPTRNENPSNRPYLRNARTVTKLYSIYVIVYMGPGLSLTMKCEQYQVCIKIDE